VKSRRERQYEVFLEVVKDIVTKTRDIISLTTKSMKLAL
jgi:hypothetical protein